MNWMTIAIVAGLSFCVFFVVSVGMAIGVMFGRRPISGSCGGLGNQKGADGSTSCSLCQNPSEACTELRARQTSESAS
jgi:hypothetical protein